MQETVNQIIGTIQQHLQEQNNKINMILNTIKETSEKDNQKVLLKKNIRLI